MARQTSKGVCTFCHGEFSKSAMTRHLETCEQRAITVHQEERVRIPAPPQPTARSPFRLLPGAVAVVVLLGGLVYLAAKSFARR